MKYEMSFVKKNQQLLSGHPRGNGNCLLNRGSSEISIRSFKKVTLFQYKIR